MNRLGDLIAAQAAARGRHLESSSLLVAPLGAVAYSFWNEYRRYKPPVVVPLGCRSSRVILFNSSVASCPRVPFHTVLICPASRGTARGSRHIPAKVRRAVWVRDGSRCAFVARSGRRCAERGFLERHHVEPHAVGGEASVDNIQLRCRAHNAYEAKLFYGPGKLVRGDAVVREPSAVFSYVAEPRTRSRTSDPWACEGAATPFFRNLLV